MLDKNLYYCFYSNEREVEEECAITYLLSGEKYGFPFRMILPTDLKEKCRSQDWPGLKVVDDIKEGRGAFVTKTFKKMSSFVTMVANL